MSHMYDDSDFTPLPSAEAIYIREKVNDSRLDKIKDIYECHGDPGGNMYYVAGSASADIDNSDTCNPKYCIYVKNNSYTEVIMCNDMSDYINKLYELDNKIINERYE